VLYFRDLCVGGEECVLGCFPGRGRGGPAFVRRGGAEDFAGVGVFVAGLTVLHFGGEFGGCWRVCSAAGCHIGDGKAPQIVSLDSRGFKR
jgi:hypothetical protein